MVLVHHWPALPGTKVEVDGLGALATERNVRILMGREANTSRVLAELPQAHWAHLATHGFFADPKFRSILQLDESAFEQRHLASHGQRMTAAARNPLVLSGLLLAGANLPRSIDEFSMPHGDGGILTAEAIAALPLDNLRLAVLSACETGLGEVAGGEGVFGLQRAFHIAGTHNVIASLWKERGPNFGKLLAIPAGAPTMNKPLGSDKAPTKLWAAFVLSGVGADVSP